VARARLTNPLVYIQQTITVNPYAGYVRRPGTAHTPLRQRMSIGTHQPGRDEKLWTKISFALFDRWCLDYLIETVDQGLVVHALFVLAYGD
jgi:hypothetical protein